MLQYKISLVAGAIATWLIEHMDNDARHDWEMDSPLMRDWDDGYNCGLRTASEAIGELMKIREG